MASRGVTDERRLATVAELGLTGHLGNPDLDAVVATVVAALDVPMAVVNVVTPGRQSYPAEVGVGASCTTVPDELSFCAAVVDSGHGLSVADAAADPLWSRNPWPELVRRAGAAAAAGKRSGKRNVMAYVLPPVPPAVDLRCVAS